MTLRLLKLALLLCALTLSPGVKAQWDSSLGLYESFFSGTLVDSLTKEPLHAAVISVMTQDHKNGDKYIRNYVSDEKGAFRFRCFGEPRHRMEVAILGYKPYVRELTMHEEYQNLGTILMSQSTQKIDEVVVKSRLQLYKMRGDTLIYMPRAVKTMKDDAALEILRQMPGVEVTEGGGIKILGKSVERTYVNDKLLFGNDPTTALKELDAEEVASIAAYDEVDEADAVANGANARKRKVLNVTTFKKFSQSYAATLRGEMGADAHKNAEDERSMRYLASGRANFFSELLELSVNGGSDNLADNSSSTAVNNMAQRNSFAAAKIAGKSSDHQHQYDVRYGYNGNYKNTRASSSSDYFPTDYFTSQHIERDERGENESGSHTLDGTYDYTKERVKLGTSLKTYLSNGINLDQSMERTLRDGKLVSGNELLSTNRNNNRFLDWRGNGSYRFKGGNSLSVYAWTRLNGGQSRGERYEKRTTSGVESPLAWDTYIPRPDNSASGSVQYTFNFEKAGNLTLRSGVNYAGRAERMFYTDLQTGQQDLVRSEDAFDKTTTWSIGPQYMISGEHYRFSADVDYKLETRVYDNTKAGRIDRRTFHFVTSRLSYRYEVPKKTFDIGFSNDYRPVMAQELSSRINDTNPLYVSTGNRSLLPSKNYTLHFEGEFMTKNGSYGFAASISAEVDPTINRRRFFKEETVLPEYDNYRMPAGSTLTTPENGASYLNVGAGVKYKVRIAPLRLFLEMEANYTFSNPEDRLYDKRERQATHRVDMTTWITTNFSSKFRIRVNNKAEAGFRSGFGYSSREFRNRLQTTMEWQIFKQLDLEASYTGMFNATSAPVATPGANLLNFSLGYRILKERGRIAFNAYDVMNDYSPIRVGQTSEGTFRKVAYMGANYFTISFDYRFNKRS